MEIWTALSGIPVLGPYLPWLGVLGLVCAALATRLPPPASPASGVYPLLYAAVNLLALNTGYAANAGTQGVRAKPPTAVIALLALGLAVSACTAQSAPTPAQVLSDTTTIITALGNSVARIDAQAPGLIPPATATALDQYIADAQALTAGLSASTAATQSAPALAQAESDLNAVVDVLATFPLPPPYGTIVEAAGVLLPVVETFVTVSLSTATPAKAATPLAAAASPMTVDEARAILLQAAAAP